MSKNEIRTEAISRTPMTEWLTEEDGRSAIILLGQGSHRWYMDVVDFFNAILTRNYGNPERIAELEARLAEFVSRAEVVRYIDSPSTYIRDLERQLAEALGLLKESLVKFEDYADDGKIKSPTNLVGRIKQAIK